MVVVVGSRGDHMVFRCGSDGPEIKVEYRRFYS